MWRGLPPSARLPAAGRQERGPHGYIRPCDDRDRLGGQALRHAKGALLPARQVLLCLDDTRCDRRPSSPARLSPWNQHCATGSGGHIFFGIMSHASPDASPPTATDSGRDRNRRHHEGGLATHRRTRRRVTPTSGSAGSTPVSSPWPSGLGPRRGRRSTSVISSRPSPARRRLHADAMKRTGCDSPSPACLRVT